MSKRKLLLQDSYVEEPEEDVEWSPPETTYDDRRHNGEIVLVGNQKDWKRLRKQWGMLKADPVEFPAIASIWKTPGTESLDSWHPEADFVYEKEANTMLHEAGVDVDQAVRELMFHINAPKPTGTARRKFVLRLVILIAKVNEGLIKNNRKHLASAQSALDSVNTENRKLRKENKRLKTLPVRAFFDVD